MNRKIILGIVIGVAVDALISILIPGASIVESILAIMGGIAAGITAMQRFRLRVVQW